MSGPSPRLRYVVLRHEQIDQPHFDLMFEWSESSPLMTVRLSDWPPTPTTRVQRIGHHRREYLEYEGAVSGGRGVVRRVSAGTCTVQKDREDSLLLSLDEGLEMRVPRAGWD